MAEEVENTDRELWRGPDDGRGDYYADRVFVTAGGGIGIDHGGRRAVMLPKDWHYELGRREQAEEELECVHKFLDDLGAPKDGDCGKLSIVDRIAYLKWNL